MYRTLLKSKIHRAVVTDADIHYEGSITIDRRLMDLANLATYEQVHVWDIDNGERLVTYVIEGERDSGEVCMNGAAARLVHRGDRIIIAAFAHVPEKAIEQHRPRIIFVDDTNRPELMESQIPADDFC
ncbi:MAG: aspartate 1-decarboxylase [Actinomycetota bacterium]|nr:aspartate 1-decarboxylase [Actinomycetota bacterium]